jgi:hypothetical protein
VDNMPRPGRCQEFFCLLAHFFLSKNPGEYLEDGLLKRTRHQTL